jgi:hypothetical protein
MTMPFVTKASLLKVSWRLTMLQLKKKIHFIILTLSPCDFCFPGLRICFGVKNICRGIRAQFISIYDNGYTLKV